MRGLVKLTDFPLPVPILFEFDEHSNARHSIDIVVGRNEYMKGNVELNASGSYNIAELVEIRRDRSSSRKDYDRISTVPTRGQQ